jgi:hypothetical protein
LTAADALHATKVHQEDAPAPCAACQDHVAWLDVAVHDWWQQPSKVLEHSQEFPSNAERFSLIAALTCCQHLGEGAPHDDLLRDDYVQLQ